MTGRRPLPDTLTALSVAVADRIQRARRIRGVKLSELADAMEAHGYPLGSQALYRLESGRKRVVTVDEVVAIAVVLDIDVLALIEGPVCPACQDRPPAGFVCVACEAEGATAGMVALLRHPRLEAVQ